MSMELCKWLLSEVVFVVAAAVLAHGVKRILPLQPQRWKKTLFYLIMFASPQITSWVGDENPVLFFPFFMAALLLSLDGTFLARLVTAGMLYALLISLNMMLDTIIKYIHISGVEQAVAWNMASGLLPLVKLLLLWGLSRIICRSVPRDGVQLSPRFWVLIGGLTLMPLTATLSFSLWKNRQTEDAAYDLYADTLNRLAFTILPFVVLSSLVLLLTMTILARHEALEQKNHLGQLREAYYHSVKQEQMQVRTLRHDLRNHLTALQGLLTSGKTAEAGIYLAELSDSPALLGGRRYCENETANVVLASKAAAMEAEGMEMNASLHIPEALPMSAPELCALLGNALDNAIEAVRTAADKSILLRVKAEKGLFMLRVENAVGGAVNPDLSTTKRNSRHHGFGIAGMREIVQRYGGTLDAGVQNGRFELVAYMPLPEGGRDEETRGSGAS